jgi:hypothetical protein
LGLTDRRQSLEAKESDGHQIAEPTPPSSDTWWAIPAVALLVAVCCAGPLLLGALVATGAGAWLADHGFLLGAAALIAVAATLSVAAWFRVRQG